MRTKKKKKEGGGGGGDLTEKPLKDGKEEY